MDLTPGPGYGEHRPITHPSSPKHVWCDECNRRWPCGVVRAYRAGREDAANAVLAIGVADDELPADRRILLDRDHAAAVARGGAEAAALEGVER